MIDWDLRTKLTLLPSDVGGRSGSISSGYRSLIRPEGWDVDLGVQLDLEADQLAPGETGIGYMSYWANKVPPVSAGARFELREGIRVIGHGVILETR